jgi:hypothetical protein
MPRDPIKEKIIKQIYDSDCGVVLGMVENVTIVARLLPLDDRILVAEALFSAARMVATMDGKG